jgi:hypothetical protein
MQMNSGFEAQLWDGVNTVTGKIRLAISGTASGE